ncbi:MAG: hypothetical protein Q4C66_14380 [Lachnospiraceae bacterium]|nr:hypothetical protein [Lachnospiraceae bacterium]
MKKIKKLASLLLALVMVLSMTVTAFAENPTITAPENSDRTYDVYQIFTGSLAGNILSDVRWETTVPARLES